MRSTPILIKYLPHGLPHDVFKPLDENTPELIKFKKELFKGKEYDFVLFFNSRNIRRKQIPDSLLAFRLFLDKLPKEKSKKCLFLLHTDIRDENGTDLEAVKDYFLEDYQENILFTEKKYFPEQMNMLYNCADVQILLTDNEGFGLSLLEARLVGLPIIANCQGGMADQMRFEDENGNWINYNKDFPSNHRGTYKKCGEWAFPVFPTNLSIQGSIPTPYIFSSRCSPEDASERIFEVYNLGKEERKRRGLKGREWTLSDECGMTSEIQGQRIIDAFDELFKTWKPRETFNIINATEYKPHVSVKHKLLYE